MKTIEIEFLPRDAVGSEYDWANINFGGERVGKARCIIAGETLTILSINILDGYKGMGFGKLFVDYAKGHFKIIIADRVRFSAVGFWQKMGFLDLGDGNWRYISE